MKNRKMFFIFYDKKEERRTLNIKFFDQNQDGDYASAKITVKFDRPLTEHELIDFYEENILQTCHCSHDCCGHWFSMISRVKRKTVSSFEMKIGYARNY